jgi:hypothetical protein
MRQQKPCAVFAFPSSFRGINAPSNRPEDPRKSLPKPPEGMCALTLETPLLGTPTGFWCGQFCS